MRAAATGSCTRTGPSRPRPDAHYPAAMGITVTGLATTAVKGMRLGTVDSIELDELGARGNRAFFVIDERGAVVNSKRLGALQTIVPAYDPAAGMLAMTFPDGATVVGEATPGEPVMTQFTSRAEPAREVLGPWAGALSTFAGRPLRLASAETAVDRGRLGAVSLISRASLTHLAEVAEADEVDGRRFRMLIEIDGVAAHEEDRWIDCRLRAGPALLRVHGHVGRCMITTRNPDSGEVDFPTLHALSAYRRRLDTTEPLAFGVYGAVLEGGTVRLGDPVELVEGR